MLGGIVAQRTKLGARRQILARVLARTCPQCGRGRIFERFARVAAKCARCGLVYRREQGAQTGSMYLTAAVNQVFAALVILCVFVLTDWSLAVELAVSIPLVVVFCAAFLPFSQTLWAGVEYVTDCITVSYTHLTLPTN